MKKIGEVLVLLGVLGMLWFAWVLTSYGETIYRTIPGTNIRDYSQPGVRIEGDSAYPTLPGTSIRDYSQPGAIMQGDTIYPTLPGTNLRDYSKPGYKIDED